MTEPFAFGRWPPARSRRLAFGCVAPFVAVLAFISVTAWIALFRGHLEAILWATLPIVIVLLMRVFPSPAARCDGAVLEVPAARGERSVPLADVTRLRAGRWGGPIVAVESATARTVRLPCSAEGAEFVAALRAALPAGVDHLPEGEGWLRGRRRTFRVITFVLDVLGL